MRDYKLESFSHTAQKHILFYNKQSALKYFSRLHNYYLFIFQKNSYLCRRYTLLPPNL